MFIFPEEVKMQITKKIYFLFIFETRQGLTLVLRISIGNGKSGLRSSLFQNVCSRCLIFLIFIIFIFSIFIIIN